MKIMHKPQIDVRIKFEEYLENNGKELVYLAYGTENMDEKQFYVGIAYLPTHCDTESDSDIKVYSPNRYDVVTYDAKEDIFKCDYQHHNYSDALIQMGQLIRKITYENK